ncbi:50S ribosomal protein L2 [Candidatus Pacearchaeota archaeon]|nr:MAG: 50S ribosomal protein L2 [Candidatus Pacearchaeota archaeon]
MGKRIIQQRRGRGSPTYRVRQKAGQIKIGYPQNLSGEFEVVKLIASPGHTAPIARLVGGNGQVFCNLAANHLFVGQKIKIGGKEVGDISKIGDLKNGTEIFNIENHPLDGGRFVRAGGESAVILSKEKEFARVLLPSKKEKILSVNCRATVGRCAGDGRVEKPILKAGKKFYIMRAKSKLWPRTSAVAMNKIDHPFGSGRGKRIKSKIVKRNSAPGKKVGLISPRRTGRKKR